MLRVVSRQNPRYREVARLVSSSRDRRKAGRCVLEGEHLVAVHLERIGLPEIVVVNEEALARPGIAALVARVPESRLVVVTRALFDGMGALPPDVGVIAVAPAPRPPSGPPGALCLLLEAIQDPGNVGTMLRTAAAFGASDAYLSRDCAFAWSPKVLRAGQGAHFQLAVHEDADLVEIAGTIRATGGRVVAAVAAGGVPLHEARLGGRVAIAVGNEGAGLSAALRAGADVAATIPLPGGSESLNAAAAAAVVLYEVARQRLTAAGSP